MWSRDAVEQLLQCFRPFEGGQHVVLYAFGQVIVRIDGVDHQVDQWPVDSIVGNGQRHSPVRSEC
ncbi:hypothetical protein CH274_16490 [Rhodococcus sp. 06-418-5]|nr:hypothetical protein CH274_16490 [Rhodococcus sp. 06-418-5]